MSASCMLCNIAADSVLKTNSTCSLIVPPRVHIPATDGGHLLIIPKRHIQLRKELIEQEVIDMWKLSLFGAKIMEEVFSTQWINYQENGNWSIGEAEAHLHLHLYGRTTWAKSQTFGEPLILPQKKDIPLLEANMYSTDILQKLKQAAN